MWRILITVSVLFFLCGSATGRGVERFNAQSAQSDTLSARVTVRESEDAAQIVRQVRASQRTKTINGYRVRIFFDNSRTARESGYAAMAKFKEVFPDIVPVTISYPTPSFIVTVGNCLTAEEAIIMWGKIKSVFEKAYVTREELALSEFAK